MNEMYLMYEKGGHVIYLTENNFEYAPMVSMSSWNLGDKKVSVTTTLRELFKDISEARVLCRKLVVMLESNGYQLSRSSNE